MQYVIILIIKKVGKFSVARNIEETNKLSIEKIKIKIFDTSCGA
jgi:hypothetical protein